MEKKVIFRAEVCQSCGSTDGFVLDNIAKEEVEAGHMSETAYGGRYGLMKVAQIKSGTLLLPTVLVFEDYCVKCGHYQATQIMETKMQEMPVPGRPGLDFKLPPNMGKG